MLEDAREANLENNDAKHMRQTCKLAPRLLYFYIYIKQLIRSDTAFNRIFPWAQVQNVLYMYKQSVKILIVRSLELRSVEDDYTIYVCTCYIPSHIANREGCRGARCGVGARDLLKRLDNFP